MTDGEALAVQISYEEGEDPFVRVGRLREGSLDATLTFIIDWNFNYAKHLVVADRIIKEHESC